MFHGVIHKITLAQFFFETRCSYFVNTMHYFCTNDDGVFNCADFAVQFDYY